MLKVGTFLTFWKKWIRWEQALAETVSSSGYKLPPVWFCLTSFALGRLLDQNLDKQTKERSTIEKFLCFLIDIEPYIKSKNAMSIKFRLCLNYPLSKLSNYDEDVGWVVLVLHLERSQWALLVGEGGHNWTNTGKYKYMTNTQWIVNVENTN